MESVLPRISCKDKETLSNINLQKQLQVHNGIAADLNKHLKETLYAILEGKAPEQPKEVEQKLNNTQESIEKSFISDYEIAGQNIVD